MRLTGLFLCEVKTYMSLNHDDRTIAARAEKLARLTEVLTAHDLQWEGL